MNEVSDAINLVPKAGFVIKTKILTSANHAVGTKVFINLCQNELVPKPSSFDPQATFQLIIDNNWEIPLIVSNEKLDRDKKGQPSIVYDCIINPTCFNWVILNSHLKSIMIEWCIEAVELLYQIVLERDYTLPKLAYKGAVSPTIIPKSDIDESGLQKKLSALKKNEIMALIEEMKLDLEEESPELPDLLNINGKKKLLIQEVDDRSSKPGLSSSQKPTIAEIDDKMEIDEQTNDDSKIQLVENYSDQLKQLDSKRLPSSELSTMSNIDFAISYHKLSDKYQLLVKFISNNVRLGSTNLKLLYNDNHTLTLSSDEYYFSNQHNLTIPLAKDIKVGDITSFLVSRENCLYIFI